MSATYEIETLEPSAQICDCCGGLTVRLTRFVHRDGDAFAIYYAAYSNNHPQHELAMLVSLGEWGEDSDPTQRTAFYCRVRPTADSYEVMLGDAGQSAWGDVDLVGTKLTREQALQHPWKHTAFELLDEAFLKDRSLRGFVHRVHCGDASIPLEMNFHAPDEIFALGDAGQQRADVQKSLATLDGQRFFVRCLLPIPVEEYGPWCVGTWIEVEASVYEQILTSWDDADSYPTLRFTGKIANDVSAELELPVALGTTVSLHVPEPGSLPSVEAPASGEIAELLTKPWSKAAFEEYAVARGFL